MHKLNHIYAYNDDYEWLRKYKFITWTHIRQHFKPTPKYIKLKNLIIIIVRIIINLSLRLTYLSLCNYHLTKLIIFVFYF